MKKMIFLAASAAFFVSGVRAADVVPNHIRHPLRAAAVKMLAPKSVVRIGATAATASGSSKYVPTLAPGGLSNANVIAGLSWSAILGDTATYADNSVQQADIGSTVAGLDTTGSVSAPLASGGSRIGDWQTKSTPELFSQGYESNLMGGVTQMGSGYLTRSLFLQTDPYTNYSGGCGLILSMMGSVSSQQFPISQQDFRGGATSVVGVGGFDTVANCILNGNQPARFVLTATGYTANSVKLAAPLAAGDAARIYQGMYITTNSPSPSLSLTNTDGELPKKNLFAGFVSKQPAAGDTSISVYAWDVPGYGTGASGQVPQTTALDTVWSARSVPTVWLGGGAAGSSFTNNWFTSVDVNDLKPSATNRSLVHQFTPLEMDLNLVNGTAPAHSIWWQGISLNAGNQPEALTTDSRQMFLGGNINHHLITNGGCGNWDIESWADGGFIAMPSLCNLAAGSAVTRQVDASWTNWIASANRMTSMIWTDIGNPSAPTGWQQAVVHIGVTVDGNRVSTGNYGGSEQGDIEWNYGGNYGSVSLCGYSQNCGLRVNGDGTTAFGANAYLLNGFNLTFFPVQTGVPAPYLSADGAGTLSLMSSGGGRGALEVGTVNSDGDVYIKGNAGLAGGGYVGNGKALKFFPTSTTAIGSVLQAADDTSGPTLDVRSTDGSWANIRPWSVAPVDNIQLPIKTLSALGTGAVDGEQRWCSDCTLNGITGVAAYWHTSASKWTDSQNGTLAN